MKNYFKRLIFSFFLCSMAMISAQKQREEFTIGLPTKKLDKSYYKTIKLLDRRIDTTSLGTVRKGLLNNPANLFASQPLSNQFQDVLNNLNGENAENGTLVLYLRQLSFAEMAAHGYFYFQAFLFSKNEDGTYSLLDQANQAIDHKAKSDVTKEILQKGSELLVDFIATNVSKKPQSDQHYTYEQIKDFEGIAKEMISLFHSPELKDGAYNDYESLKNQQPNKEISRVKFYGNAPKIVRIYETVNGEEKEIRKDGIYAIIYKGELYIYLSMENLFTKAEKKDNDYYFVGKIKANPNLPNLMPTPAFPHGGGIGVSFTANPITPFEMKIDYFNGDFIPIKEVENKR
ncbi:hypothetical protein BBH99_16190 [Chryseobacterium contaminans]|uniref:Uncharacterized protein n=1 Tax=Chryseobacterium contaminans TaxID=1423959 RepID=A0A1M7DS79_9FLAO|nr:hypothetical protein [Chryseobacterium contaminans]OCA80247.1 hypothetical protein BBH99_16190 [Chryseobacterium contaminans]SHL82332.1 hypothetical protein SAMN05444407_106252 [Chryseobacterium contaminans]